ncbi:hypothetical protein MNBD_NITROSPINAE02-1621 [hydrothermal vent metagenome]|uniref:Rod shape-determining protein MreD n=1 Tax=hydrothermal vent metagenome TaxID=652676 RepID=A0A3B1C452_9ZZZZ
MRVFVFLAVLFIFLVAQTTAFHFAPAMAPWPDFALLLTIYAGLKWGKFGGIQFGAVAGLMQDFLSYETMGIYFCSKAAVGFIVGKLNDEYIHDTTIAKIVLVVSATFLDAFMFAALMQTFIGYNVTSGILSSIIGLAIINVAFSFVAFPMMGWIDSWLDKLQGKTSQKFFDLSNGE